MRPIDRPVLTGPLPHDQTRTKFAEDVRYYLTQQPRQLPSRYLYDALGLALFEAICRLPWYRITRAEIGLLAARGEEILASLRPLGRISELGPGSGEKLAQLLKARRPTAVDLPVHLVDVSRSALALASRALSRFDNVRVVEHEATYEAGMEQVSRERDGDGRALTLFLGSNLGNFDPPSADALLRHMRMCLRPRDALLLGADLVKPEAELLLAYDDPLGVTAAFNRNLLIRVNRDLGGNFDINSFAHRAIWNPSANRVEMHLVSQRSQRVEVPGAGIDITMDEDETIWTESSYKYDASTLVRALEQVGFETRAQWLDSDARFALTLVEVP